MPRTNDERNIKLHKRPKKNHKSDGEDGIKGELLRTRAYNLSKYVH